MCAGAVWVVLNNANNDSTDSSASAENIQNGNNNDNGNKKMSFVTYAFAGYIGVILLPLFCLMTEILSFNREGIADMIVIMLQATVVYVAIAIICFLIKKACASMFKLTRRLFWK